MGSNIGCLQSGSVDEIEIQIAEVFVGWGGGWGGGVYM